MRKRMLSTLVIFGASALAAWLVGERMDGSTGAPAPQPASGELAVRGPRVAHERQQELPGSAGVRGGASEVAFARDVDASAEGAPDELPTGPIQALQQHYEEALAAEDPNPNWTREVLEKSRQLLASDTTIALEVACAETLCRIKLTKPSVSELDWAAIDLALLPVATGETMMSTEDHGDVTVGYVYFAADEASLPHAS